MDRGRTCRAHTDKILVLWRNRNAFFFSFCEKKRILVDDQQDGHAKGAMIDGTVELEHMPQRINDQSAVWATVQDSNSNFEVRKRICCRNGKDKRDAPRTKPHGDERLVTHLAVVEYQIVRENARGDGEGGEKGSGGDGGGQRRESRILPREDSVGATWCKTAHAHAHARTLSLCRLCGRAASGRGVAAGARREHRIPGPARDRVGYARAEDVALGEHVCAVVHAGRNMCGTTQSKICFCSHFLHA